MVRTSFRKPSCSSWGRIWIVFTASCGAGTFNIVKTRYVSQDEPRMQTTNSGEKIHATVSNSPKLSLTNGFAFPFPFSKGIYSNDM